MDGAAPQVRILERVTLPAPFGIAFWDFATGAPVADSLVATISPQSLPDTSSNLIPNRSGVWLAPSLPGLSSWRLAANDWSTLGRTYRLSVSDPQGRFLPMTISAELPSRGLYEWPDWAGLPLGPLAPLGLADSPPAPAHKRIPLFSSPARPVPAGLAEVRCQLADMATGNAAAWALVTVAHKGATRGLGLADANGNAAILFRYPERPSPSLATSPPAIPDYGWDIDVQAYWDPSTLASQSAPGLSEIFAQLSHPRDLLASTLSPPEVLPVQQLTLQRPLVLRTEDTPTGPSSMLFVGPG